MMGIKMRAFEPLVNVSLEDLVPHDHFYRHVDHKLDISFVRELVRSCYAPLGRPSVDPVVFFKLQLIMFFEGIRSERSGAQATRVRRTCAALAPEPAERTLGRWLVESLDRVSENAR